MGRIRGIPGTPGRAAPGQFCNPGLRYQRGRFAKGVSFLGIMFKFDRIKRLHPGVQATVGVCYSSIQELIVPRSKSEDRIHRLVPLKK